MYNKAENIIGASLRELSVYDTILACIAGGCDKLNDLYLKTGFSRAKISVYMKNLAASDIIEKAVSFETGGWENAKKGVYRIRDNYVNFWFRFIYKYRSAVEIGNMEYLYKVVERDYDTYSGIILEKYFRQLFAESNEYSDIQGYWDNKGENEIDLIAVNDMEKRIVIGEVKRNAKRISLPLLERKAENIIKKHSSYQIEFRGFSLEDM